jgi:hypothetical protein
MREFKYLVIRRDQHDVLYYCGKSQWSVLRSEAAAFSGEQASVLCENLGTRGIDATFVLA